MAQNTPQISPVSQTSQQASNTSKPGLSTDVWAVLLSFLLALLVKLGLLQHISW